MVLPTLVGIHEKIGGGKGRGKIGKKRSCLKKTAPSNYHVPLLVPTAAQGPVDIHRCVHLLHFGVYQIEP